MPDRNAGKAAAIMENLPGNTRRTDALESAQVPGWWAAVEQLSNPTASVYLRALLLTGGRREELAALTWENVDVQWRKLTIADKVEATRMIPLSPTWRNCWRNCHASTPLCLPARARQADLPTPEPLKRGVRSSLVKSLDMKARHPRSSAQLRRKTSLRGGDMHLVSYGADSSGAAFAATLRCHYVRHLRVTSPRVLAR